MRFTFLRGALLASCGLMSSAAFATSGSFIPLDSYTPGMEPGHIPGNLVTNGDFEATDGLGEPVGWTKVGSFRTDTPIGPNIGASGNKAAQGPANTLITDDATAPNKYTQTIAVQPGTQYMLSGYMWTFADNFDFTVLECVDSGGNAMNAGITLANNDAGVDGGRGVFGYKFFNSGSRTSVTVEAEFDIYTDLIGAHSVPLVAGQIDNVSLVVLPEPAALSMLAVGAVGLLRRRRI